MIFLINDMKFLIQKINGKVTHDFSLALLEAIRYQLWLQNNNNCVVKYINTIQTGNNDVIVNFKAFHKNYVPVGSVEFVCQFLKTFYNDLPRPINIPNELINVPHFTKRKVFNGNHMNLGNRTGSFFLKDNEKIKSNKTHFVNNPAKNFDSVGVGNFQISELINIESEWRAFVYKNKLVGLQNYCGDFTLFPDVTVIDDMINAYKSAPIAYTLDVGVNHPDTFIIEVHDFFSCGLYGFTDYNILPHMLYRWFKNYIKKL